MYFPLKIHSPIARNPVFITEFSHRRLLWLDPLTSFSTGVFLENIVRNEIRVKINAKFGYTRFGLTHFP